MLQNCCRTILYAPSITSLEFWKIAAIVTRKNAWRGKPQGDLGKQSASETCWGRLFQVRAAATGEARSPTCMYDGQSQTVRKRNEGVSGPQNRPFTGTHLRGTTVLSSQEQWAWTRCPLVCQPMQCSCRRRKMTWSNLDEENTGHAVKFMTLCSRGFRPTFCLHYTFFAFFPSAFDAHPCPCLAPLACLLTSA